ERDREWRVRDRGARRARHLGRQRAHLALERPRVRRRGLRLLHRPLRRVPSARHEPAHVAHERHRGDASSMRRILPAITFVFACGKAAQMPGQAAPVPADGAPATPADADIDAPDAGGTPLDPMAAFVALDPTCASGWCWYWPTPTGNNYFDVYATAT